MTGIKSPQNASLKASKRSFALARFWLDWMFFLRASIITTMISATPIRIPGTIPAVNISAMETPVMDA